MANFEKLAAFIIQNVGGEDNIENISHCMTRLRIKLKDDSKANRSAIDANNGIISSQIAEGKLQVIIGTQVGDVYEEIIRQTGKTNGDSKEGEKKGSFINRFAALITKIVVPSLGVLCACGIIAGLNSVLLATGVIQAGSGTNVLLNAMGNACLTFFPVILGYTSAKAFGMDPFVGMILGAVLIFPGIADTMNAGNAITTIFSGTAFAMPVYKTFFGLPIVFPKTGYTSTLIPIMLITWFASKLEVSFKKNIPAVLKQFMVPFLTILIGSIVGILLIGPVSMVLQNALSASLNFLISKSKILAFAVITLIYQPLVIFGLHWPLITLGLIEFATNANSLIVAAIFPASFTHMAACLAVFLRTKSTKMKNISLPAFLSACFCIIEPSIYGVTLPVKKRFGFCMVGGLVGGSILVLSNSPMYAISMGITGVMSFVDPNTGSFAGMIWCAVACIAAFAVTFCLTWFSYHVGEDGKNEDDTASFHEASINKKEIIYSPMKGEVRELSEMGDQAFSNGQLGKGVCIIPEEGKIVSPCEGVISALFPTGHAIGIKSNTGAEVLIHVGKDTYNLPEGIFKKLKAQGDKVKTGDTIIEFDLNEMKKNGMNTGTAVVVTNTKEYLDIMNLKMGMIDYKDKLMVTVVPENLQVAPAGAKE